MEAVCNAKILRNIRETVNWTHHISAIGEILPLVTISVFSFIYTNEAIMLTINSLFNLNKGDKYDNLQEYTLHCVWSLSDNFVWNVLNCL